MQAPAWALGAHLLDCLLAIRFEDSHRTARAHAVAMQEQHDLANLFCLAPCSLDSFPALGPDAIDRLQFGGSILDDAQDFGSEPFDQFLRQDWSDPLYQAAAQIPLDPFRCGRRYGLHHRRLKLQPVLFVPDPPAIGNEPFSGGYRR